jgi:hypothetical protein
MEGSAILDRIRNRAVLPVPFLACFQKHVNRKIICMVFTGKRGQFLKKGS